MPCITQKSGLHACSHTDYFSNIKLPLNSPVTEHQSRPCWKSFNSTFGGLLGFFPLQKPTDSLKPKQFV